MNELEGIGAACTNCVKYTERKRPELLPAQHMRAVLEAERGMGEKEIEHTRYCGTCWKGGARCRGLESRTRPGQNGTGRGAGQVTGRTKTGRMQDPRGQTPGQGAIMRAAIPARRPRP